MAFKRNNNVIDNPGNNFATLNPLVQSSATLSGGNLKCAMGSSATKVFGNFLLPNSGKWYWEVMFISGGDNNEAGGGVGIAKTTSSTSTHVGNDAESYAYRQNGHKANSSSAEAYHDSYTNLKVIQFLWNGDNKSITFGVDGSMATSEAYAELSGEFYPAFGDNSSGSSATFSVNFGQDHTFAGTKTDSAGHAPTDSSPGQFYYPPPEGAKALCTANLPSFDGNPQEHFRAVTWVGDDPGNGNERSVTVGMKADLIWAKNRDTTDWHQIYDSVRGFGPGKNLNSDQNGPEDKTGYGTKFSHIVRTDDNKFYTQNGIESPYYYYFNEPGKNYVAWTWKAGGGGGKYNIDGVPFADFADTGLTAGDITPDGMSVNTKAGFSITSFNSGGDNPAASISHGLNQRPDFFIMKQTDGNGAWWVWSSAFSTASDYLYLHMTDGISQLTQQSDMWGSGHDATTIGFRSGWGILANKQYICYAWHSVPGYSAFGSYTGNSSADGPFVYTGFKPAFLMVKRVTGSFSATDGLWTTLDSTRKPFNGGAPNSLYMNNSDVEFTGNANRIDFLSNGFKLADSNNNVNSSEKFIYMAFAEHSM